MIQKIILSYFIFLTTAQAMTFNEAVNVLQGHVSVEAVLGKSKATLEQADLEGSWGDPKVMIAAKNFPKETFKKDESPMTGVEFGVSQKISITTKYANIKNAFESLAKAYTFEANDKKQTLTKALWQILILERKINEEIIILNENQKWINKILNVSKKLYANGKISQQAILDIQIRNSEIESEISNKKFELAQLKDKLNYIIGNKNIEEASVPWGILNKDSNHVIDNKELSLQAKLRAKQLKLSASELNYIPDLTLSVGITKRSNIDGNGDFASASVSFPIPISSEKYALHGKAIKEKYSVLKEYENYKKNKNKNVSIAKKELQKIEHEISILKNKTIRFASNSRSITSKSYGLGNSSYIELLQSELKLQKILMKKIMLEAKRDITRVELKYSLGEPLNE